MKRWQFWVVLKRDYSKVQMSTLNQNNQTKTTPLTLHHFHVLNANNFLFRATKRARKRVWRQTARVNPPKPSCLEGATSGCTCLIIMQRPFAMIECSSGVIARGVWAQITFLCYDVTRNGEQHYLIEPPGRTISASQLCLRPSNLNLGMGCSRSLSTQKINSHWKINNYIQWTEIDEQLLICWTWIWGGGVKIGSACIEINYK